MPTSSSSSSIGTSGEQISSSSLMNSMTKSSVMSFRVIPTSSSSGYLIWMVGLTIWTSMAVRLRLWTSSMPSFRVRPLHESGIPAGPNLIMVSAVLTRVHY